MNVDNLLAESITKKINKCLQFYIWNILNIILLNITF